MYRFLLFLVVLIPVLGRSQETSVQDTVTMLSLGDSSYALPPGCIANSKYQIQCGEEYEMAWLYVPPGQANAFLENTMGSMAQNLPNFRKEKIDIYLFGEKHSGYRLYFTRVEVPVHQVITTGQLGKYSMIMQVVKYAEIKTNSDLPEFARKFISLP